MVYTVAVKIKTKVSKGTQSFIMKTIEEEFKKVSKTVSAKKNMMKMKQIKTSAWGKGYRKDISTIALKIDEERNGYVIETETRYKKPFSFYFWDYLVFSIMIIAWTRFPFDPEGLMMIFGWLVLWRLISYCVYFGGESEMKKIINNTLNAVKQAIENNDSLVQKE